MRQSGRLERGHSHGQQTALPDCRRDVRRPHRRQAALEPAQLRRLGEEGEDLLRQMSATLGHQGQLQVGPVLRHQDLQLRRCRPVRETILVSKVERRRVSSCRTVGAGYDGSLGICAGKSAGNDKLRNP